MQTVLMIKSQVFFCPETKLLILNSALCVISILPFCLSIYISYLNSQLIIPFSCRHFSPFNDRRVLIDIIIIHLHE